MGQYYCGCVLKKNFKKNDMKAVIASIYPHDYSNGAKLMEHSYVGNEYVKSVMQMIALHNGKPFVWCGDYADELFTDEKGEKFNTYMIAPRMNPNDLEKLISENDVEEDYKYIVNYTKREYVEVPEYNEEEWTIHPLPLLCADGNDRGSGDAHKDRVSDYDLIGTWAYNRIGVTNKRPHYKKLKVNFVEHDY